MLDKSNLLTVKGLRKFSPLNRLNDKQLILLVSHHEIKEFKKRATVVALGSSDNKEYFLIQGKLQLTANDGKRMEIEGGTDAAMRPVAHLQPRQYKVKVLEAATFLLIDWLVLAQFIREAPSENTHLIDVQTSETDDPAELIRTSFYQDLSSNNFNLPSMPVVASNIRDAMEDQAFSVRGMAKLINADPAMVVKVISASNSPIYRGTSKIQSSSDAVVRLGMETTRQLVEIYALRELFGSHLGKLQSRMQVLWEHSQKVGAIAYTLAKLTSAVNPEQALLAGLIHDVGVIPVLHYAGEHPELIRDACMLEQVIRELRGDLGEIMLTKWGWSDEMLSVVKHAEDWRYESGEDEPDLTDIVIIAQIHAWIGCSDKPYHPPMEKIWAFSKMKEVGLTPEKSIEMLIGAKEQTEQVRRLIAGE